MQHAAAVSATRGQTDSFEAIGSHGFVGVDGLVAGEHDAQHERADAAPRLAIEQRGLVVAAAVGLRRCDVATRRVLQLLAAQAIVPFAHQKSDIAQAARDDCGHEEVAGGVVLAEEQQEPGREHVHLEVVGQVPGVAHAAEVRAIHVVWNLVLDHVAVLVGILHLHEDLRVDAELVRVEVGDVEQVGPDVLPAEVEVRADAVGVRVEHRLLHDRGGGVMLRLRHRRAGLGALSACFSPRAKSGPAGRGERAAYSDYEGEEVHVKHQHEEVDRREPEIPLDEEGEGNDGG